MKKVEAVVRTSRLDAVVNRLCLIGITGLTVEEVHGMSPVAAIVQMARTDAPGDGLVTVSDVDGIMRIRTGEVDVDAI